MPNERKDTTPDDTEYGDRVFERVKFLIDKHYEETKLYWIRANVFLVLHAAALTLVVPKLSGKGALPPIILMPTSIVGMLFCLIWLQVNRMSVFHFLRWFEDAKQLASTVNEVKRTFLHSVFYHRQPNQTAEEEEHNYYSGNLKKPKGPGSTACIQILVGIFFFAWLAVFLYAVPWWQVVYLLIKQC